MKNEKVTKKVGLDVEVEARCRTRAITRANWDLLIGQVVVELLVCGRHRDQILAGRQQAPVLARGGSCHSVRVAPDQDHRTLNGLPTGRIKDESFYSTMNLNFYIVAIFLIHWLINDYYVKLTIKMFFYKVVSCSNSTVASTKINWLG